MKKTYCVQGIDHFTKKDNEVFWSKKERGELALQIIGLSCTSACNYCCNYCYGQAYNRKGQKLTLEEQISILDQAKEIGAKSVIICGDGEPTIDKDLIGIVEHCKKLGMPCVIVSNGNIFGNDKLAKKIFGIDSTELVHSFYRNGASFVLKLDSLIPQIYEQIVGVKGSFAQFKEGCEKAFEMGFNKIHKNEDGYLVTRIAFTTVVSKLNFVELPELRRFAHSHSCQYICKFPSFVGNAIKNRPLFFPPTEETTIWLRENYLTTVSEKPETVTTDHIHCGVWHYGMVIGETGDVRLCYTAPCSEKMRVGNIRDSSLRGLLQKRLELFEDMLNRGESCHIKRQMYQKPKSVG